ncbi:MAG: MlaE family lipid ABC transporter permease subunit [Rhizobiales bacterium]|nr:MlaE family lipid ABC transporter permease subunit [Hyphomicrobiales bacterium]
MHRVRSEARPVNSSGPATLEIEDEDGTLRVVAHGDWTVRSVMAIDQRMRHLAGELPASGAAILDIADVGRLDTAGAWILRRTVEEFELHGIKCTLEGMDESEQTLFENVDSTPIPEPEVTVKINPFIYIAGRTGDGLIGVVGEFLRIVDFIGQVFLAMGRLVVKPSRLRLIPLVHHMEKAGMDAVPLVCLLTGLIGGVVAQQGATQLRQFGADVFTVNLVAIIFLREVGILLTAIIVAGRSGSAFTAEIGSMKMREEIDAMRTLGLDPMEMLVLPRILALIITLPILTFLADIMGLIGGGIVVMLMLNMSPDSYIARLQEASDFWTFGVGLVKAPFMALMIGLIGCRAGLAVAGSAESVGSQTTRSVVQSIFVVIILDAFFALFFTAIGI